MTFTGLLGIYFPSRDGEVRSMLDSLDMQMKQREEDVRQEKEDSIKQVWDSQKKNGKQCHVLCFCFFLPFLAWPTM